MIEISHLSFQVAECIISPLKSFIPGSLGYFGSLSVPLAVITKSASSSKVSPVARFSTTRFLSRVNTGFNFLCFSKNQVRTISLHFHSRYILSPCDLSSQISRHHISRQHELDKLEFLLTKRKIPTSAGLAQMCIDMNAL